MADTRDHMTASAATKAAMLKIAKAVNDAERKRTEAWMRFARKVNEAIGVKRNVR